MYAWDDGARYRRRWFVVGNQTRDRQGAVDYLWRRRSVPYLQSQVGSAV